MKKTLLIIGIVIIVLAGIAGVYWFITPVEERDERFALFGFGDTTDESVDVAQFGGAISSEDVVDVFDTSPLKQLTTTPIIAHQEVLVGSTTAFASATTTQTEITPFVYYVEAGTGHVYTINLSTGEEERLSNITIPRATAADISSDGRYAVVRSDYRENSTLYLINLDTQEPTSRAIASGVIEFEFGLNRIFFSISTPPIVESRVYDLERDTTNSMFSAPFSQAVIDWNEGRTLIFPAPTTDLVGYLYEYVDGSRYRLPVSGFGLSATGNGANVIYSVTQEQELNTYLFDGQLRRSLALTTLAEKCALGTTIAICGGNDYSQESTLPDSWYRGETVLNDTIWEIDLDSAGTRQLVAPAELAGRDVDVTEPNLNTSESRFYFINKTDQSLWLYQLDSSDLLL